MKRFFSLFIVMLMLLAIAVPAFAEGTIEQKTIYFQNGTTKQAYVVAPFDYLNDWDMVGDWGDRFSFGSTMTSPFNLFGAIQNCYGVSFEYGFDEVTKNVIEIGLKPGMRMDDKWTFGDKSKVIYPEVGETKEFSILNMVPGNMTGFTVVTNKVINQNFNYSFTLYNTIKLYFATEKAANNYLGSIGAFD